MDDKCPEVDSRGYSIYDPARAYDWVPKVIRDKRKREKEKLVNEENEKTMAKQKGRRFLEEEIE